MNEYVNTKTGAVLVTTDTIEGEHWRLLETGAKKTPKKTKAGTAETNEEQHG